MLGIVPGTRANWRHQGGGPRFVKVGSRVRYRACDVEEWLDRQTRVSTSGTVAP
jgi:predicted DNA-binding transcriptional regulator AlpA